MIDPQVTATVEKIVQAYGQVLAIANEGGKYMVAYPQSLLPCPKETISQALQTAIHYEKDKEMVRELRTCLALLDLFIEDEDAEKQNAEVRTAIESTKRSG